MEKALSTSRSQAWRWCHQYNNHLPADLAADFDSISAERLRILRNFVRHVGEETFIEHPFRVNYSCNIRLEHKFYANFNLTILDCAIVTIGNRVMFGPNVSLSSATHETDVRSRRDGIEYAKPIAIGDDCWIGGHIVVLPGVTIGEGCTIGAGSVVTKNIPAGSVAIATPARVARQVTLGEAKTDDSHAKTGTTVVCQTLDSRQLANLGDAAGIW